MTNYDVYEELYQKCVRCCARYNPTQIDQLRSCDDCENIRWAVLIPIWFEEWYQ